MITNVMNSPTQISLPDVADMHLAVCSLNSPCDSEDFKGSICFVELIVPKLHHITYTMVITKVKNMNFGFFVFFLPHFPNLWKLPNTFSLTGYHYIN